MTACCPFLSKHGNCCRHILDITSGPSGISSLETRCSTLTAASSGRARNASQALSGMVLSMTSGSNLVKYALSKLRRSWDNACMKVCQASRRRYQSKPRMLMSKESVSEFTDLTYVAASSGLLCEGPFVCSSSIVSWKKCIKMLSLLKDSRYLCQSNRK